jgi:hypothetical protein
MNQDKPKASKRTDNFNDLGNPRMSEWSELRLETNSIPAAKRRKDVKIES